jgi:hypothetical protein
MESRRVTRESPEIVDHLAHAPGGPADAPQIVRRRVVQPIPILLDEGSG